MKKILIIAIIFCSSISILKAQESEKCRAYPLKYKEDSLFRVYSVFMDSLNSLSIPINYPKAIKNLLSTSYENQKIGIRTLAETKEIEILPWIIPFLSSKDDYVRIEAIIAIKNLAEYYTIKRRDFNVGNKVVIKPLSKGDKDLRSIAWLVLQNLRYPNESEPNVLSYAALTAGYLNLNIFDNEIKNLSSSIHPAVVNCAKTSLEIMGWFDNK